MSMDMFISLVFISAIFGGLWRYAYCHGFKNGYEMGYEQGRKDYE